MELIFITIVFLGFAILGISIKIWGKKKWWVFRYMCKSKSNVK